MIEPVSQYQTLIEIFCAWGDFVDIAYWWFPGPLKSGAPRSLTSPAGTMHKRILCTPALCMLIPRDLNLVNPRTLTRCKNNQISGIAYSS